MHSSFLGGAGRWLCLHTAFLARLVFHLGTARDVSGGRAGSMATVVLSPPSSFGVSENVGAHGRRIQLTALTLCGCWKKLQSSHLFPVRCQMTAVSGHGRPLKPNTADLQARGKETPRHAGLLSPLLPVSWDWVEGHRSSQTCEPCPQMALPQQSLQACSEITVHRVSRTAFPDESSQIAFGLL